MNTLVNVSGGDVVVGDLQGKVNARTSGGDIALGKIAGDIDAGTSGGNVRLEEGWFYPTEDQPAELKRYRAGELDWTEVVPASQMKWIRQNLPHDLVIAPYLSTYFYGFNNTKPPFRDNPNLRRALALHLPRGDAVMGAQGLYCCESHRQRHEG